MLVSKYILRGYQTAAVESIRRSIQTGHRKPVMVMPTGAGKSCVFAEIIRLALGKGNRVLWLVHRRNLVLQMRDTLRDFGIDAGVIMSGVEADVYKPVQVSTIQTLIRRLKLADLEFNRFFVDADIVMIDEAHRAVSKSYIDVINLYREKILIGCTATPMRADGRGLGQVFDDIVDVIGVKELTDEGYLSKARYFVPSEPDLAKLKIVMGDYQVKELSKRMNKPRLVGGIVTHWFKYAEDRQTIVFCVDVKHAISVKNEFIKCGVQAYHLDARSSDDERDYAFNQMEKCNIKVITNVALYIEGLDCPNVSCVVMARPTKSMGLYRQCIGRGLRPAKGKVDTIIIDHGGVVYEHGFVDEQIVWSLDGKTKAWSEPKKIEKKTRPVKCEVCHAVFEGVSKCPDCGSPVRSYGREIASVDGELKEAESKATMADKRRFYGMLELERLTKGYKTGWTANQYRSKFGVWPRGMDSVAPIPADQAFKNWLTYQRIKYIKGRERANATV